MEKDSMWIDEGNQKNIRYTHNFLATKGSRKGSGFDHIIFTSSGQSLPQYTAYVSFHFRGDTSENYNWEPVHFQDYPEAFPYHTGFKSGAGVYGQVSKYVGNSDDNLVYGQWCKLLIRENGWGGDGQGAVSLRGGKQAGRSEGWFVHLDPGTVLRTPPGVKGLRVFDVQGRLHWETRDLQEGVPVDLPAELPQGHLRYHWQAGPG